MQPAPTAPTGTNPGRTLRYALTALLGLALLLAAVGLTASSAAAQEIGPCDAEEPLPGGPNTGLTNMGFETGDFTGWTQGHVTDSVDVTGADAFTSPWEGDFMAVLGTPADSSDVSQEPGPNEICQDFVVTDETEQFVYNLFTYDYTGFDEFRFNLEVTDPDTGEVLDAHQQQAWGASGNTDLKTTGWQGVLLELSEHEGETVRLTISAGGTQDNLYPFWAYLDSSDERELPEPVAPAAEVTSASGSVMVDPSTGQLTIAMPQGDVTDVTITADLEDPDCVIASAELLYEGESFAFTPISEGSTTYTGTIPAEVIANNPNGQVVVEVTCEDGPTQTIAIGEIVLYDPSGIVSDAETGDPVVGAEVFLHKAPGAEPDELEAGDGDCRTVDTREGDDWTNEPDADAELGNLVSAASPEISPNVNPFVTNDIGYYGWDVARGCWYVIVEADGYETRVSPVVGVPPEVTDLDLELTPLPGTVAGTVTDADTGDAIEGAAVTVDGEDATTDADGDYSVTELAVGDYTVTADADGYESASQDATVAAGEVTTVDFALQPEEVPPEPVKGTIAGTVTDADTGDAIEGAAVTVDGQETSTDADGDYTVDELDPGAYTATADADGYQSASQDATVAAGEVTTADFALQPEGDGEPRVACPEGEVPTADFVDRDEIPEAHRLNVDCAAWRDIVSGFADGSYGPGLPVRRDQMATFIAGMLDAADVDLPQPGADRFDDVPAGSAHDAAIHRLAEAEIVLGGPEGMDPESYGPSLRIRRDQLASFLLRAAEFATGEDLASQTQAFDDVPPGNVHFANINGAAETGYARGFEDGTYRPALDVRRDQMGSFVIRVFQDLFEGDQDTADAASAEAGS